MSATDSKDNHIEFLLRFAIQSLPDKKIRCPENWNVLQLKQFLEQDCSSKPAVDSQRLIYAGHCLKNEQLLKEIFDRNADRSNNDSDALQVVHLVCASPDQIKAAKQLSSNNEGLRNRATSSVFESNNAAGPATNQLPTFENIPQDINTAYAQAYHNYLQNYYSQNRSVNNAGIHFGIGRTMGNQVTVMPGVQNAAVVNPQAPVAENNAAAAHPELNEHPDFLDLVYKLVRFAFLAAIVFYSSMDRIIFVIGVICLMWYVQMRRERDNRNVRQQNDRAPNVNREQQQQVPNQQQPQPPLAANPNNNGNDSNNNELPAAAPQPQITEQRISAWNVFWSTVVSFFSSLIPEPVPVVN